MATATTPERKWAREYETIYILRPTVDGATAEKIAERATDVIKRLDGQLTKLDNWGKRRLAYPIQKHSRGQFVHLKFVGYNDLVAELERNLRLLDDVIRFQTVLLTEQVDPAAVAVDPEEVKYLHLEDETEEEESPEEARARSLGMGPAAVESSAEGAQESKGGEDASDEDEQEASSEDESSKESDDEKGEEE
jgi:small subunit ribosomal protein S6